MWGDGGLGCCGEGNLGVGDFYSACASHFCAAWTADGLLPAEVLALLCRVVLAMIIGPRASRHRLKSERVSTRRCSRGGGV